jgi:hypothetical protein
MAWLKGIGGVVCVVIGLLWVGQGTNVLRGSDMSGHLQWAIMGLLVLIVGVWLLWSVVSGRRRATIGGASRS